MLPLGDVVEDGDHLVGVEGLLLQERRGDPVERLTVRRDDHSRFLMGLGDELADLVIDGGRHLVGEVLAPGVVAAEEDLPLGLPVLERTEPFAHPVLHHHLAGERGRPFDVVRRPGRRVPVDDLLGGAASECVGELVDEFAAFLVVLVLEGQRHRISAGPAPGDDRDFVDRIEFGQREADQCVTALVVRGEAPFFLRHDATLALGSGDDPLDGLLEFGVADQHLVAPGGEDRPLVDQVGKVCSGEPGGLASQGADSTSQVMFLVVLALLLVQRSS